MDIIYFLLHLLKDPLTTLQDFLTHYEMLTYVILAVIIFVETGLIVMPLLPAIPCCLQWDFWRLRPENWIFNSSFPY